jgi:hypothetical protein
MVTQTPARAGRNTARRIVPLFRPYRRQVAAVIGLIVVTSTIGIINPLLIQAVFNKALTRAPNKKPCEESALRPIPASSWPWSGPAEPERPRSAT